MKIAMLFTPIDLTMMVALLVVVSLMLPEMPQERVREGKDIKLPSWSLLAFLCTGTLAGFIWLGMIAIAIART